MKQFYNLLLKKQYADAYLFCHERLKDADSLSSNERSLLIAYADMNWNACKQYAPLYVRIDTKTAEAQIALLKNISRDGETVNLIINDSILILKRVGNFYNSRTEIMRFLSKPTNVFVCGQPFEMVGYNDIMNIRAVTDQFTSENRAFIKYGGIANFISKLDNESLITLSKNALGLVILNEKIYILKWEDRFEVRNGSNSQSPNQIIDLVNNGLGVAVEINDMTLGDLVIMRGLEFTPVLTLKSKLFENASVSSNSPSSINDLILNAKNRIQTGFNLYENTGEFSQNVRDGRYIAMTLQNAKTTADNEKRMSLLEELRIFDTGNVYVSEITELLEEAYVVELSQVRDNDSERIRQIVHRASQNLIKFDRLVSMLCDVLNTKAFDTRFKIELLSDIASRWKFESERNVRSVINDGIFVSILTYILIKPLDEAISLINNMIRDYPAVRAVSSELMLKLLYQLVFTQNVNVRNNLTEQHISVLFDELLKRNDPLSEDESAILKNVFVNNVFITSVNTKIRIYLEKLKNWAQLGESKFMLLVHEMNHSLPIVALHDSLSLVCNEYFNFVSTYYQAETIEFIINYYKALSASLSLLSKDTPILQETVSLSRVIVKWLTEKDLIDTPFLMPMKLNVTKMFNSWYKPENVELNKFRHHRDLIGVLAPIVGYSDVNQKLYIIDLLEFRDLCFSNNFNKLKDTAKNLIDSEYFNRNISVIIKIAREVLTGDYVKNSGEFKTATELFDMLQNNFRTFHFIKKTFGTYIKHYKTFFKESVTNTLSRKRYEEFEELVNTLDENLVYLSIGDLNAVIDMIGVSNDEFNVEDLKEYGQKISSITSLYHKVKLVCDKYDQIVNVSRNGFYDFTEADVYIKFYKNYVETIKRVFEMLLTNIVNNLFRMFFSMSTFNITNLIDTIVSIIDDDEYAENKITEFVENMSNYEDFPIESKVFVFIEMKTKFKNKFPDLVKNIIQPEIVINQKLKSANSRYYEMVGEGFLKRNEQEIDNSIETFEELDEARPNFIQIKYKLIALLIQRERYDEAIEYAETLLERKDEIDLETLKRVYCNYLSALGQIGDIEKVKEIYNSLPPIIKDDPITLRMVYQNMTSELKRSPY